MKTLGLFQRFMAYFGCSDNYRDFCTRHRWYCRSRPDPRPESNPRHFPTVSDIPSLSKSYNLPESLKEEDSDERIQYQNACGESPGLAWKSKAIYKGERDDRWNHLVIAIVCMNDICINVGPLISCHLIGFMKWFWRKKAPRKALKRFGFLIARCWTLDR